MISMLSIAAETNKNRRFFTGGWSVMFTGLIMAMKARQWCAELVSSTGKRLFSDRWLYLAIACYCVAGATVLIIFGRGNEMAYGLYFDQWTYLFLFFMPVMAIILDWAWIVVRFNEQRSIAILKTLSPHRLAHMLSGMALLMGLMFFQGTFTSIKNVLPDLRGGFLYDRWLADIDMWLSFGTDPWVHLAGLFKNDVVRAAIDTNYGRVWFVLCFGGLFYVATSPRAADLRVRYVSMFMLVWVVCGNILAGLFISAGPVFYGAVTGDKGRFAGLSDMISSGEWASNAVVYQRYLWSLHESGATGLGSGISAFPSVHVGLITLNALFIKDISPKAGAVAFAYVAFVMASSVFLGWHYAVDGYASLLVVVLMHYALKRLMSPAQSAPAAISPHVATASA
jgi:hypothetical protein